MNPESENPSPDEQTAASAPVSDNPTNKISNVAVRAARRPSGTVARKSSEGGPVVKNAAPPDTAKTIAFAVCGVLAVGILGLGGYLVLRPKAAVVAKAPLDKLVGEARALAEKALKAEALYKEGKEKPAGTTLAELRDADEKLTEANKLFNEIVDSNQSVAGYKEQIDLAQEKKLNIDKELRPIRVKIDAMESEERINRSKAAAASKTTDGTSTPTPAPVPGGKAPEDSELTNENLDRLFKDDPSEYERLAKFRKAKDPSYVIKHD